MIVVETELMALLLSAAGIAFTHTLMGPDHYLPFVAVAMERRWRWRKLLGVTLICAAAHLVGSVLLGAVGIALQAEVGRLAVVESVRGELAAWLLLSAGLVYLAWGIHHAGRGQAHRHVGLRPQWLIFLVFVLGPCEPLIPLLMYPAVTASTEGVIAVTAVFGMVTVLTMLLAVTLSYASMRQLNFPGLHRYGHALSGATLSACGASILFLGL
jgi:hypothetical protein